MTNTAKFNVGGTKYEVSRSLLETHPDIMISKSASEQWQKDPESEIFIDRDGTVFRFVLNYLRDGKVTLPATESRESFMAELEYYGIKVEHDKIDDTEAKLIVSKTAINKILKDLQEEVNADDVELRAKTLAIFCINQYFRNGLSVGNKGQVQIDIPHNSDDKEDFIMLCRNASEEIIKEKVNPRIKCLGIELVGLAANCSNPYVTLQEITM